jgi:hypothetical protein
VDYEKPRLEHYVTLFDSFFLPQGLALYASMERHVKDFVLWILCMDDATHDVLATIDLKNAQLLLLSQLETDELLRVKSTRSKAEYCWTLTPFAPRFVFEADPSVTRVTYLDADLWFRKPPTPIFREFDASGKHVLITDHAYAPDNDASATSGQYCVQFMTFKRDDGEKVRKWWEERCIEWCYARFEDGKFGDQKYLDDWPEMFFDSVHVLSNKELALAPWNATRFPYGNGIFWHFQSLRLEKYSHSKLAVYFGPYTLPRVTVKHVYRIYAAELGKAVDLLSRNGFSVKAQQKRSMAARIKSTVAGTFRNIRNSFPAGRIPL